LCATPSLPALPWPVLRWFTLHCDPDFLRATTRDQKQLLIQN
jgi:hypothetical protein